MSGDTTYQGIKRISWLPERAANENGTVIGGQEYTDVEFIGGSIANVTLTDVTINGVETERNERVITTGGDVTIQSDDYVVTLNKVDDEATTVILPDPTTTSRSLIIKDGKGDANTYNITLDPGGYTIDSGSSYVIDSAYGCVEIIFNGTEWNILNVLTAATAGNMVSGPLSSTNNAVSLWNGTTGDTLKDSNAIYNGTDLTLDGNVVYRAGGTDVPVADGGTGVSTLTGYVKGNGTSPFTASATIPNTDITGLGTMSTQDANNVTISGGTITGTTINTPNMGFSIRDTGGDNSLTIMVGEDLTANRTLNLTVANASRNVTFTGNASLEGTSSGVNTGDQTITLTGDVTGTGTGSFAATIANDAVTYAKMQNVSAASRLLGRGSAAGAGDVQELTAGKGMAISGTSLIFNRNAAYDDNNANTSITGAGSAVPNDNTVPLVTEGVEILSVSITPSSASARIRVSSTAFVYCNGSAGVMAFLTIFADSTFLNGGGDSVSSSREQLNLYAQAEFVAGTTSPITVSARLANESTANTIVLNANLTNNTGVWGGGPKATLIVEEV